MKWKAPRNGGNNNRTRAEQSARSKAQIGITPFASTGNTNGHHRVGKRNPTGATSHAPKEWGAKARKEEERLTALDRQAKIDAISEGLEDLAEGELDEFYMRMIRLDDHTWDGVLNNALDQNVPGVYFDGVPLITEREED